MFSERIRAIGPSGRLTLKDGGQIILAGIKTVPEAYLLMRTLLLARDVDVEYAEDYRPLPPGSPKAAYVFVRASEIDFPFRQGESRESRIHVNELLLRTGSAKVDESAVFDRKEDFLRIQASARESGEGVWSYQPV